MNDLVNYPQFIPVDEKKVEFAYQCEDISFSFEDKTLTVIGYPPGRRGAKQYPNPEAEEIKHYVFKIAKFTGNSIDVNVEKVYKDGRSHYIQCNFSFSSLVNAIFKETEAWVWIKDKNGETIQ